MEFTNPQSSSNNELETLKSELATAMNMILDLKAQINPVSPLPVERRKRTTKPRKTAKQLATERGQPWVDVINTHVNMDNIRNGFFELDWNDEFIVQLKREGYGADGDEPEAVVDRWFRDLARNMLAEDGLDTTRGAGYVNVTKIGNNRSIIE